MAKFVVTNTQVTIATVAYQAQITEASLEITADVQDVTNMASGGWKEIIGGLKSFTVTLGFAKDADLSGLDAVIFAAAGTVLAFTMKQTSAAISTSNPEFQGSFLVDKWTPISGKVGEVFGGSYTFPGTALLVRDVTP